MSLCQFHGELPPASENYLTPDGMVKDYELYDPIAHFPLTRFSENDAMYDKEALRRFRNHGDNCIAADNMLLPWDMRAMPKTVFENNKQVFGLVLNYGGMSFLLDSHEGSIWEDPQGTLSERVPLKVEDNPLNTAIMNQFYRVGHYCNFQNLLYEVEARVYYNTTGDFRFIPLSVTPWVGEIFQHFPRVGNHNLFEAVELRVAAIEGLI